MRYFRCVAYQLFTTLSELQFGVLVRDSGKMPTIFFFLNLTWRVEQLRLFHCFPVEGGAETASLMSGIEFRDENLGLGFFLFETVV